MSSEINDGKGKENMKSIKSINYYIRNYDQEFKPAYERIGVTPSKKLVEYRSPDLLGSVVNAEPVLVTLLFRTLVEAYEAQVFDAADHHECFATEAQFEKWARKTSFGDEDVSWEVEVIHDTGKIEKYICCGSTPVPQLLEEVTRALKERYPQLDELQKGDCR